MPTARNRKCAATASAAWRSTSTTTASAATKTLKIETGRGVLTLGAGSRPTERCDRCASTWASRSSIRRAFPTTLPGNPAFAGSPAANVDLNLGDRRLQVTCVSMGNPHCVTFVDEPTDHWVLCDRAADRDRSAFSRIESTPSSSRCCRRRSADARLGARLGRNACLRHRRLRGVRGRRADRADGTQDSRSICPAAIWNWSGPPINHVYMTGPAVEVFSGEWH